jgi:predicted RNA binding protein YcfA (HicA-like mRNA interferase family)
VKLPRGISADRVIRALERLAYGVVRQKGSHVRMRHPGSPVHTIARAKPGHNSRKYF